MISSSEDSHSTGSPSGQGPNPPAGVSPVHISPALARIDRDSWHEWVLTAPGASLSDSLDHLPEELAPLSADLFGSADELRTMKQALAEWCPDVPCTEIVCACAGFGGAIVHAVTGAQTSRLCVPGGGGGSRVDFSGGRQVILCGLQARDKAAPPAAQAGDVLAQIVPALSAEGLDLADTVRTWFFNSKILDWYLPFNATRTTHFLSHGVLRMPASTGVGAENSASSALTAKLIALRFRDSGGTIAEAESPLQCHAFSYGSAFSRGLCVSTAAWRTLHVSGTAAIEPDGKSAHPGDPAAQIEMTLQVLEALLEKSGMALGQTTRAIAYFPEPAHAPLLAEALARRGLYEFPYLVVPATICRPDLLFEMELDAAAHAQISGDFFRHQPILKHAK